MSDALAAAAVSSAAWLAAAVVGHGLLFRCVRVERRARAIVSLFAAAAIGHTLTARLLGVDGWRTAYGLVALFCAFILYMPMYYTIAASLSVGLLIDLARAPRGCAIEEVRARFDAERVLDGRLATLVRSGYAVRVGDRYRATVKGRLMAEAFNIVKQLWRLGPGG